MLPLALVPPGRLPASLALPAAAAGPPAMRAIYVGIQGGPGTVVSASPADLTVGPITDIQNFRVSIDSGVW